MKKKNFMSEYFLGSRSLGVWAFALTFAATSSSGGSFMGFPSKIYTHGWSLGLWIGSYMVVPICVMGILGKRINEVARTAEAITIPDVLRDRFRSVAFGLVSVSLIVFFMTFNLIAQFKGGSTILKTLLGPIDAFTSSAASLPDWVSSLCSQGNEYLLCLVVFGVAVIVYTTYGGFHAVVWTDVSPASSAVSSATTGRRFRSSSQATTSRTTGAASRRCVFATKIGRAHVGTPVTSPSRMPSSA